MIMDETQIKRGPLSPYNQTITGPAVTTYASVHNLYEWSSDNSAEVEKGWVVKADTIEELASKIGVDPAGLSQTISNYNGYCAAKQDTEFGRSASVLLPVQTPPYYASELCMTLVNTQGGPKHNKNTQVLDTNDRPIPRLYAAGELGSIFGHLYTGGQNFPEALGFGRVAGGNAATEESRS
jgi:succinate dehydrogenase/fumarate reductase flavoprotein subunit